MNWLGKRRTRARALSNFCTTGARLSEREAEAEDQEITTCLFSRVMKLMIGLILLTFAVIKHFQVFFHHPIAFFLCFILIRNPRISES